MRTGNLFWGIVVLLLGVLLLLGTTGILPASINVWGLFWPILLILAGAWFLLNPLFYRRAAQRSEELTIPLEGATEARVRLKHGAGKLVVGSLDAADVLLTGTFWGGVESSVNHEGNYIKAKLKLPTQFITLPSFNNFPDLSWSVNLNRLVPMRLDIDSGASASELDLTDLKVTELHIDTGASSTMVQMPSHAGFTQVYIESGAASVKMRIPQDVAAIIHVDSTLAGVAVDSVRFPQRGAFYASDGYEAAPNRAEIHIQTGVGSVEIK